MRMLVSQIYLRSLCFQNWQQFYCLEKADAYICKDEFLTKYIIFLRVLLIIALSLQGLAL